MTRLEAAAAAAAEAAALPSRLAEGQGRGCEGRAARLAVPAVV